MSDKPKLGYKKTEIGEIPEGWEVVRLGDASLEIYRYPTYYNIEYVDIGLPEVRGELIREDGTLDTDLCKYRFISKQTSSRFPRTTLKEGDFVLSVRGTMGKIGIVPKELEGSNITANLMRISPDRSCLNPFFLKQYFQSQYFQNTLGYLSPQTTIKTITAPVLKSIKLPLPPLPEQQKIAEILSTADHAIQKTEEIIKKAQEFKKGLMQQLLTRGISHMRFKQTEIGEIPEDWEVVKLGDEDNRVADIIMGQSPPSSTYNEDGNGLPFLQGKAEFGEIYPTPLMYASRPIRIAEKDDILISVRAPIGEVNLAPFKCCIGRGLSAIRPDPSKLDHKFVFYYLKQANHQLLVMGTGSTFTAVRKEDLRGFLLPLPPLPEQKKIVEILSTVDDKMGVERKRKEKLEELKKGLMQVLLTGKVRVKV